MKLDIEALASTYFALDEPVPYKLNQDRTLFIKPVSMRHSPIFLSSVQLLDVDKNSSSSVEIIQMSYLQFLLTVLLQEEANKQRLINLLKLCLDWDTPSIGVEENQKMFLYDKQTETKITAKQFEDVRRIILYQNLPKYSDEYINPEIKQKMVEFDEIKNRGFEAPSMERKMAIITAHCGLSKQDQLEMTYRSHSLLFDEVCGEVEFITTRPIALYAGGGDKIDHWIFPKQKGKFDKYLVNADTYAKSMGGEVKQITSIENTSMGDNYINQLNTFNH